MQHRRMSGLFFLFFLSLQELIRRKVEALEPNRVYDLTEHNLLLRQPVLFKCLITKNHQVSEFYPHVTGKVAVEQSAATWKNKHDQ